MFMEGTIEQWLDLLKYFIMILAMFTGIGVLSWILANKTVHTNNKRNNYKPKKLEKKSYFLDVA